MHRAKVQFMELHDPYLFASELRFRTDDPPEWIGEENYFLECRAKLNEGDEIKVACIADDGSWLKAVFEVSVIEDAFVGVEQITEWRHGGKQVMPGLEAKHIGFGKWNVLDKTGRPINKRPLKKEEAEAWVNARKPAEEAEAA